MKVGRLSSQGDPPARSFHGGATTGDRRNGVTAGQDDRALAQKREEVVASLTEALAATGRRGGGLATTDQAARGGRRGGGGAPVGAARGRVKWTPVSAANVGVASNPFGGARSDGSSELRGVGYGG